MTRTVPSARRRRSRLCSLLEPRSRGLDGVERDLHAREVVHAGRGVRVGCFFVLIGQARHARSPASHIQLHPATSSYIQAFTTSIRVQHSKTIQSPRLRPVSEIHSIAQHFYSRFPAPPPPCCSSSSPFDPLDLSITKPPIGPSPPKRSNKQQNRLETSNKQQKQIPAM